MGSAFHQLCPRYNGTLTPTAPTAIQLWDTFTFTFYCILVDSSTVTCWMGPFIMFRGVRSIIIINFYSIFDGKSPIAKMITVKVALNFF